MQDVKGPAWRDVVIQDFARSELFERTFQEGMELVEETASYLDGAGRQESKLLSRNAALAYAAERGFAHGNIEGWRAHAQVKTSVAGQAPFPGRNRKSEGDFLADRLARSPALQPGQY